MDIKKTKEASLENKKLTFLLMGFVFVLSLCYVALEWTEKEVAVYEVIEEVAWNDEELDIQQTQQQETPPPPQPEQVIQEIEELVVVEDEKEVARIEINTEDNDTKVEIAAPVQQVVEE